MNDHKTIKLVVFNRNNFQSPSHIIKSSNYTLNRRIIYHNVIMKMHQTVEYVFF